MPWQSNWILINQTRWFCMSDRHRFWTFCADMSILQQISSAYSGTTVGEREGCKSSFLLYAQCRTHLCHIIYISEGIEFKLGVRAQNPCWNPRLTVFPAKRSKSVSGQHMTSHIGLRWVQKSINTSLLLESSHQVRNEIAPTYCYESKATVPFGT